MPKILTIHGRRRRRRTVYLSAVDNICLAPLASTPLFACPALRYPTPRWTACCSTLYLVNNILPIGNPTVQNCENYIHRYCTTWVYIYISIHCHFYAIKVTLSHMQTSFFFFFFWLSDLARDGVTRSFAIFYHEKISNIFTTDVNKLKKLEIGSLANCKHLKVCGMQRGNNASC